MPINNKKLWEDYKERNTEGMGQCIIDVAQRVMDILDFDSTPLKNGYYPDSNTAHGIICMADDDIGAGGITGSMAMGVVCIVGECHSRGEEFRKSNDGTIEQ